MLEGLAENHQKWTESLLSEVRALPHVIDEMSASARAEIDRQLAIERETQQRTFRHLQEEVAACDAELARVGSRLEEARATVARLAAHLDDALAGPEVSARVNHPIPDATPTASRTNGSTSQLPETTAIGGDDGPRQITVSVRGARRATLGLSIREHLQRLPYIDDVALSNYAENVLCLEVVAQRRILLEDALSWEQIPGIRIISVRPNEIEAEIEEFMSAGAPLTYVNTSPEASPE